MSEIKFYDWRLTCFWIGMTVAAAIFGFVAGWGWRDRPDALADVSILKAMTAIGTVGAALSAVVVAFWQNSELRKERRTEAILIIGEAYPRFSALRAALLGWKPIFEQVESVDRSPATIKSGIASVQAQYSAAALPNPRQLLYLGGSYARGLAAVISHLETVLRIAASDPMATREDRVKTSKLVVEAFDVAIPNLKILADTGYELISKLNDD
ncbi:hypothetical protein [Bordetella petrii]|uniref:hypothetical protein n=1 Tax=Bordetella petrii TaxID=94624 RepID=UPI0004787383|nr:hypothetical protein [Bordetella petrii]